MKIYERYNLTHFHDQSEFYEMHEIKPTFNVVVDNYFEDHVISNLDGKLRGVSVLMVELQRNWCRFSYFTYAISETSKIKLI